MSKFLLVLVALVTLTVAATAEAHCRPRGYGGRYAGYRGYGGYSVGLNFGNSNGVARYYGNPAYGGGYGGYRGYGSADYGVTPGYAPYYGNPGGNYGGYGGGFGY